MRFVGGLLVGLVTVAGAAGQTPSLGVFQHTADIGEVRLTGSVSYDESTQEYLVAGDGANVWGDRDEFRFVWRPLRGDFILRAHVEFLGEGVAPHRKLGWMIRSNLETDSPYVDAVVHGDGLTSLQFRRSQGGDTEEVVLPVEGADVLQLERTGDRYIMSAARFGETFVRREVTGLALGDEVLAGIFVCSHNADIREQAVFRNVRIVVPPEEGYVPYQDYIGSNLEVLDVETGHRKIVHRTPDSMQAPNWTTDGKSLIYNRNGLLYRFDLATGEPGRLDTGFAGSNNNDHVLSFDGEMLGISHHSADHDNQSIIYVLPATGGEPRRVTDKGPSYLHGWSPDGRFLVYTGIRDGEADIYRISVEGGEEERLTSAPGLDDGSEYSPDGKYIYFNSVRSGSMELWRMKPDGSQPEQLTDDEFNNWFPHVSPDGKWVAFLSYQSDVDPGDHPFYRQVYLRLMPAGGGAPRVIAYVFGGQGTINVPSWSPDSRRLAFVSNLKTSD